jgi:hypothetical protein
VNDTFNLVVNTTDSTAGTGSYPNSYTTHPVVDTLPVTVTSTFPQVIEVDSTSIWNIPARQSSMYVRLIARGPGTAQIIVDAADPWKDDTTNVVVVTAPSITLNPSNYTLGAGQQYRYFDARIPNGVADTTYVALHVSDTSVAGFSPDTVIILPGDTYSPDFTVYAKDKVASVQLTATAPGFTQGQAVLVVQEPQLYVSSTTTGYVGGPSRNFNVYTGDETGDYNEVRNALNVTLASTNPAILTLDSSTVTMPAGRYSTQASWTPVSVGTAYIVATAPGYGPDTTEAITVQIPPITLSGVPSTLGVGQRADYLQVNIPFSMPDGDTTFVNLSNSNPSALSVSAATVMILPGRNWAQFAVVGAGVGTSQIQATATGFTDSPVGVVDVGTPVLELSGSASGNAGSTGSYYVYTRDHIGNSHEVNQDLNVTFTVDNPAVADFGGQSQTTVVVQEGTYYRGVVLNYKAAGTVTVTASADGYEEDPPTGIVVSVSDP